MSRIVVLTTRVFEIIILLFVSLSLHNISISVCQQHMKDSTQMTRLMERHSDGVRQWLCTSGQGLSPDQWSALKNDCINPRISELMPENGINTWQKCSERVADLCDDNQWADGKECAKETISNQEVGEMHDWYRSRVMQMRNNLQIIKSCYQQQKKNAKTLNKAKISANQTQIKT